MKRKALLICSILVAFALIPAIKPVQATPSVTGGTPRWSGAVYTGTDTYLLPTGGNVIAYTVGTDAVLLVKVSNDLPTAPFNVYVAMDWATTNQTSGEAEIQTNRDNVFQMSIPIPTTANTLVLHSYKILVKYEDRTTSPATIKWLGPYTETTMVVNFAVYSADQTDAQLLKKENDEWRDTYEDLLGGFTSLFGLTANAKELWTKGAVEDYLGDETYRVGSFADAKTHYGNALNYTKDAVTSDIEKTASFEDALIGLVDAGKSFLSMQGYAYIIASIGFLFIGIGAMIYLIRRSKPPAAS